MHIKRPSIKQRLLNNIYGDWYEYSLAEINKGKRLVDIALWFTQHDGIQVTESTLSKWIKARIDEENETAQVA